jgi:hypothetical protein
MRTLLSLSAAAAFFWIVPDTPSPRTGRLHWLAGCWEQRRGLETVQEFWTTPAGGQLFGIGRTIVGADSTVTFEVMRIYERGGKLLFAAQPAGQPPAQFTEKELTDSTVVFANPAHDFPQYIRYRRLGPSEVAARVDGKMGEKEMAFDTRYRRVACPS